MFESLVNPMSVDRASRLAKGLLVTNKAPAFALSFAVPLWRAVCSHLASDGLSKIIVGVS